MDRLDHIVSTLTHIVGNRRKRHVVGGVLLSISLLFGGFAVTVMSIKNEEKDNEQPKLE